MSDALQPDASRPAAETGLDDPLRTLFGREDPPADLGSRILARARESGPRRQQRRRASRRGYGPRLSLCVALLAVCALVTVGVVHRRQIAAKRAQMARARLLYALDVTTRELGWAERRLNQDMAEPPAPLSRPVHGRGRVNP